MSVVLAEVGLSAVLAEVGLSAVLAEVELSVVLAEVGLSAVLAEVGLSAVCAEVGIVRSRQCCAGTGVYRAHIKSAETTDRGGCSQSGRNRREFHLVWVR